MKRSHALLPDVMLLTSLQMMAGGLALPVAFAFGCDLDPARWWAWRRQLAVSSALLLCGTLCTNVSLVLLSVSFTHVIKTCEPFFAMVIVSVWDRSLPRATAVLATATTVSGVLLASLSQRRSAGKAADLGVGIALAMLANLSLQLRNVLNKRLMWLSPSAEASARGDAGRLLCEKGDIGPAEERRSSVGDADPEEQEQRMGGGDDGAGVPVGPMMPAELLLVSLTAALPMQLAIHAGCCGVSLMLRTAPSESRYAHYGDANPLWIIVPPLSFVAYQLASIGTLARVEPVLHAVLNAIKRIIVIGLGALWMREPVSVGFGCGATVAIGGAAAFAVSSRVFVSHAAHARLAFVLALVLALLFAAYTSGALDVMSGPSPPPPATPTAQKHQHHVHDKYPQPAHGRPLSTA
mmetsp:Transcript_32708/g.96654  ORF Transcript_32708/g.96654 Transcript_32708/m.96654 type:complete len:408 (-) Transcript_32708:341-1564(-)